VCFFLRSFQQINSGFGYLFQNNRSGSSEGGAGADEFSRVYGWLYNCKMVSEFEGISINEAWDLPVYQFLNDLSYLKMKREVDNEQEKRLTKKLDIR